MARTTKRGTCELCGASANVGMNHGAKVCPQCTHVQSALNNRIESVAAAARSMGKTEELLGYLIPAGGGIAVKMTADFLQEISGIVDYEGEDPGELVAAVRKRASGGAQQLTSEAEAGALRTIAGIVGYDGTDGSEVVAAVRRRVLTCASCDCEDVLHEIREIVEYSPNMGDSGLADAVRAFADRRPADVQGCAECDAANALLEIAELVGKRGASSGLVVEAVREWVEKAATLSATGDFLRGDLLRACGLELDDTEDGEGWDVAAAAAIQTIAIQDDSLRILAKAFQGEVSDSVAKTRDMAKLEDDFERALQEIETVSAKLTLAEHTLDEWESRAVQAESNVEMLEAELKEAETRNGKLQYQLAGYAPEPCASTTYLLDIALKALRGEGPDANQLATLIDAARRAA